MKKWLLLAVLSSACASSTPAPVLTPVTPQVIALGINDGFHSPLPAEIVDHYCGYGRDLIVRSPVLSGAGATELLTSVRACPRVSILLLVEHADLALVQDLAAVASDAQVWGVELGNELDLAGLSPQAFGAFVTNGMTILRAAGYTGRILSGGIYTVSDETLAYLTAANLPAGVTIGLHWYGDTSTAWLARVQTLGVPVAVTEFGMPSCTPAQDAAQLAYLQEKLSDYPKTGNVLAAIVYQRGSADVPCDTSDASHFAHFGLESHGTWKPGDSVFR